MINNQLLPQLIFDSSVSPFVRVRKWYNPDFQKTWQPTAHQTVEVTCVEKGCVRYKVDHRTVDVSEGQAIAVPLGIDHGTSLTPETRAYTVHLDADVVHQVSSAMNVPFVRDVSVFQEGHHIRTLSELLVREGSAQDPGTLMAIDALAEVLAVQIVRKGNPEEERRSVDPRIQTSIDKIYSCFHEPLTVDDLARVASLSRYHFSRLFRQCVGVSPYRFLINVRIQKAAELLRRGNKSVTEVAFFVGFQDLSRFAQAFQEHYRCLPSQMFKMNKTSGQYSRKHNSPTV